MDEQTADRVIWEDDPAFAASLGIYRPSPIDHRSAIDRQRELSRHRAVELPDDPLPITPEDDGLPTPVKSRRLPLRIGYIRIPRGCVVLRNPDTGAHYFITEPFEDAALDVEGLEVVFRSLQEER